MNIQPTKGSKEQAEDYINKRGKWAEKGEVVVYIDRHGEIKGAQGQRKDFEIIEELIDQGKNPEEIMSMNLSYRKHEKIIRDAYFAKRSKETPFLRDIKVYLHIGKSGSGKSYTAVELIKKHGEGNIYFLTDWDVGGFDKYCGQPILFGDEFKGQMKFSVLLNGVLSPYKSQLHSRYTNIVGLWGEVHLTTVIPPEKLYKRMVDENQEYDTFEQLRRRITIIVYHWKDKEGNYHQFELPMKDYIDYETLKAEAESSIIKDLPEGFMLASDEVNPFI